MELHECKVNRWKQALPSFQGWMREELGAENVGQTSGWIVSSCEPLLMAQLADDTLTYRSSDFTVKHNSWLSLSLRTENNACVCCVRGGVFLVSPLSFAGQPVCWLICSSCNEACCFVCQRPSVCECVHRGTQQNPGFWSVSIMLFAGSGFTTGLCSNLDF